jgi:hypothetical protein
MSGGPLAALIELPDTSINPTKGYPDMDLKDLTPTSETIEVKIVHPTTRELFLNDDESPMSVEVYAPHTKNYKTAVYKQASARMKVSKGDDIDFEALENASIDLLAGITKSWNITYDGKKPKLTEAKAKEVYDTVFWLKMQVEEAINTFEVFTKN